MNESRNFQANSLQYYSLSNIKMLIIDDDSGLCQSIKFFFEDHDSLVYCANNGTRGLEMFDELNPDIVLVDLNMPGLDGHSIVSHISRKSPHVPVIVVSGTGVIKEAIRSMNLGAWDFVSKPILHFEDLELSVLRALEKAFLIKENRNYKENLERLVETRTHQLNEKSRELSGLLVQIKSAKEKVEHSDKLKSEFLAQISHEIRTPINAIVGSTEMIKMELDDNLNEGMQKCLSIISKAGKRLIKTIELILNMSELQVGAFQPVPEELDIAVILDDIISQHASMHQDKGIQCHVQGTESVCKLKTDRHSVEQIFSNLIDNAYKFTVQGAVTVTLRQDTDKTCTVLIEDTGVGISMEYLPLLFQPFSQEEQGYSRCFEGNGLGLALTKKYCDLNNITINVNSVKNQGTTVSLSFK